MSSPLTARHPDEIIAIDAGQSVQVGRFIDDACELACQLPDHRYVINLQADRYAYLLTFYAAIIAGQCTLMPPNRQEATLAGVRKAYPDSYTIDRLAARRTTHSGGPGGTTVFPDIPTDRQCAIAFTSGTTGTPKANRKYWSTLRGGSESNRILLLHDATETVNLVATVPPQHMWGLETSILLPVFANVAVCNQTPFFPQDFVDILAAVPEPRVLVSAPIHLEALLKSGVVTAQLSRIYTATATLSRELALALEDKFDTTVIDVFGCSETGILAVRRTSEDTLWTLADAFRMRCGTEGTRVSAAHLTEDVELPDSIELANDNQFRLIGRQQDMINIAGKRGSMAEMNLRLRAVPGVADAVIFLPDTGSERLAALVVAPGMKESDILRHLKPQIEPAFLPRPLYRVDSLPREATGKLPAAAVQEFFERLRRSRN